MTILVTGSIAYDTIMSFPGRFSEHILADKIDILSVSFLVDSHRREPGGCAANIAYNLALLGEAPAVMATVGENFEADRVRLASFGVDTSLIHVVDGTDTASFYVSTDEDNCQIASFYVGAMGAADQLSLYDVRTDGVTAAIISPNAPAAMERYVAECRDLGLRYVYDPSQQIVRLSPDALRAGIDGSEVLIANEYEFELIRDKTGLSVEQAVELAGTLIVTRSEHGSVVRTRSGEMHVIPIATPHQVVDPTGVGDAYRSGVLFGMLHGLPWPVAGRVGALAATYAIEVLGTQRHHFTPERFLDRYAASFGPVPNEVASALRSSQRADTPRVAT
jgi:adenosine kinase